MESATRGRGRPARRDWLGWEDLLEVRLAALSREDVTPAVFVDLPGTRERRVRGRIVAAGDGRITLALRDGTDRVVRRSQFRRARLILGLYDIDDLVVHTTTGRRAVVIGVGGRAGEILTIETATGRELVAEDEILHADDAHRERVRSRITDAGVSRIKANTTARKGA